jgi:hypothetical protein
MRCWSADPPAHPNFPGVGFITLPELSWRRFDVVTDIIEVGQHVACEFLQVDTTNLEARLSLRAMQPDPFQAFADQSAPGREPAGRLPWLRLVLSGAGARLQAVVLACPGR